MGVEGSGGMGGRGGFGEGKGGGYFMIKIPLKINRHKKKNGPCLIG